MKITCDACGSKYSIGADVHGVVIDSVRSSSDAGHKGLHAGDVVVQVNQRPVNAPNEVLAAVGEARSAGRPSVFILVSHNGRNIGLPIKFDEPKASTGPKGAG